jgi:hypothetical protein
MEVTITFLDPHGPSSSYVYPQQPDILSITLSQVLTKADPRIATGRTYTSTSAKTQLMIKKLKHKRNY